MTREIEVSPTPLRVVRAVPRSGVVDLPPVDLYAARRWRFLRARPVNTSRHLDVGDGEYSRHAQPLHWMGLVHALVGVPHVRLLRNKVFGGVVVSVLGAAFLGMWEAQMLLAVAAAVHSGHMVWRGLGWRMSSIIVTDRRLICPRGVISRSVASTPLHLITNHEVYQSWLGRVLGYGTLRIESGGLHSDGSDRELIRFVADPDAVDRLLGAHRGRSW